MVWHYSFVFVSEAIAMNEKELLMQELNDKEQQLSFLEQESKVWSSGPHKNTSIAITTKMYVGALREKIKELKIKLERT